VLVEHRDEAGIAALVRALRAPLGVGGGEEEHVHPLDERAVLVRDRVVHLDLLEPVGQAPRVEAVLQLARAVVVELGHAAEYPGTSARSPAPISRRVGP
jgi:hypothetical protein